MRADISDSIIHFTKGGNYDEALSNLWSIMKSGKIDAFSHLIKGRFQCVCFTESPLDAVRNGFLNLFGDERYSPFGIKFLKRDVFAMGGRPVIYSSDEEFCLFNEETQWRHVRYEPVSEPPIDFTWEREWRLRCDALPIFPNSCEIVVPDPDWKKALEKLHEREQMDTYSLNCCFMSECQARYYIDPFRWKVSVLKGDNGGNE